MGTGASISMLLTPNSTHADCAWYPGTMGLEQIDYLLADRTVLPPELQAHCTEAVVYLPDCYQVTDAKRVIADRTPTRTEAGLPESGFVIPARIRRILVLPHPLGPTKDTNSFLSTSKSRPSITGRRREDFPAPII